MGETDKNIKPNSLEDSLMEMRNQLAERAKELTSLQKTVSFSVPSYAIKALQQYQENMADIQEHIAPYSRMMTEAIRQWDKQREMIMPVIEKIADEKSDKVYHAVYLENEYIKVMILPHI